jgi:hypothetical protein
MKLKLYISSILSLLLTYLNAIYTGDDIASVFGYIFTIFFSQPLFIFLFYPSY